MAQLLLEVGGSLSLDIISQELKGHLVGTLWIESEPWRGCWTKCPLRPLFAPCVPSFHAGANRTLESGLRLDQGWNYLMDLFPGRLGWDKAGELPGCGL